MPVSLQNLPVAKPWCRKLHTSVLCAAARKQCNKFATMQTDISCAGQEVWIGVETELSDGRSTCVCLLW